MSVRSLSITFLFVCRKMFGLSSCKITITYLFDIYYCVKVPSQSSSSKINIDRPKMSSVGLKEDPNVQQNTLLWITRAHSGTHDLKDNMVRMQPTRKSYIRLVVWIFFMKKHENSRQKNLKKSLKTKTSRIFPIKT